MAQKGDDNAATLHKEVQNFERQRRQDKTERFQVVARVGFRIFAGGLVLHVVQITPSSLVRFMCMDLAGLVFLGSAFVVFLANADFDLDDFLHRHPTVRRGLWSAMLCFSISALRHPFSWVTTYTVGPELIGFLLLIVIACWGLCSCTTGDRCPYQTTLLSTFAATYQAGLSIWSALHGVGCELFDLSQASSTPTFLVCVAALWWWRGSPCTERKDEDRIGARMVWIFTAVSYLCVAATQILAGLLLWSSPDCMPRDSSELHYALTRGTCMLLPFLVLAALGRDGVQTFVAHRISVKLEQSDALGASAARLLITSVFLQTYKNVHKMSGPTLFGYINGLLARLLTTSGLVIMSTLPPTETDMDVVIRERPNLQALMGMAGCVYVGIRAAQGAVALLYVVPALLLLQFAVASRRCIRRRMPWNPKPVHAVCAVCVTKTFADAAWLAWMGTGCASLDIL
eukprot:TRINITY_DN10777_c0_g1_i3.p1 TRINITY_DN10777_c0_g1~~TRINITY_DN10777_c0_g1_i3.p1  ORF type:complete len:457 (+),score=30.70 TRINITY_DN10777_c0_g1_i3:150-1520(+)